MRRELFRFLPTKLDLLQSPLVAGQNPGVVQSDLLSLADETLELSLFPFVEFAFVILAHQGVEAPLLFGREFFEFSGFAAEVDEIGQRHVAQLANGPGNSQIQPRQRLLGIVQAIKTLDVDLDLALLQSAGAAPEPSGFSRQGLHEGGNMP